MTSAANSKITASSCATGTRLSSIDTAVTTTIPADPDERVPVRKRTSCERCPETRVGATMAP